MIARIAAWLLAPAKRVTLIVLFALSCGLAGFAAYLYVHQRGDQQADTLALCAFRADVQKRAKSGEDFLRTHPNGIPGIPGPTLRVTVVNAQRTLTALRPLVCPGPAHPRRRAAARRH